MRYHEKQMMEDARLIYAQWKQGKAYSIILFHEVLAFFMKKYGRKAASSDNIFSKMKLLYSLSEQSED